MNKLIAILLLLTVTCFGGSKFVSGKFVSGAMPTPPIVYPDLVVNSTNAIFTAGVTYQYNNIILTNGGDIIIDNGDGVPVWTVIVCNNLKMYSGSLINLPDVTVWNQSSPTIATNAIDGQSLSAVYQPHVLGTGAAGAGGFGGDSNDYIGGNSSEFHGGYGGAGYAYYQGIGLNGGVGGDFGGGYNGEVYNGTASETCPDSLYSPGGGGGAGGYSKNFLYLRVKVATFYSGNAAIIADGINGYQGGNAGDVYNLGNVEDLIMGKGGDGGSGGNGGVVVQRSANGVFIPVNVANGSFGSGGNQGYEEYLVNCNIFYAGSDGQDGQNGNVGTFTNITP